MTKTKPKIDKTRLARVMELPLLKGSHAPPNGTKEFCVLEAVAYVAGEPHSDSPACASPIIASFLRSWNDSMSDEDRNRLLKPLIPKLVGTNNNHGAEDRRAWMIVDWLIREFTPSWLRLAKLEDVADALASVAEVKDAKSVEAVMRVILHAKDKAAAAWAAAWAAARAAAWDAAGAAAWAAAWDAAGAAAGAALKPTVTERQQSAVNLIIRLCEVK